MIRVTQPHLARAGLLVVLLAPACLFLALGLASGGFFPASTAVAALAMILLLTVRLFASPNPFPGVSPALGLVGAALIAFATWTLLSSSWSGSAGRSTFEYNRMLLYIAVFVLIGV